MLESMPNLTDTILYLQNATDQNQHGYAGDQPYDFDFYYRYMPESDYKQCFIPGVEEAKCFPSAVIANHTTFCNDVN